MPALSPALLALVKKSQSKHTRTGNSVQLKEGKTTIRVLSKPGSLEPFWADCGVHWIKTSTAKGTKPVAVVGCSDVVHEAPCAICTAIAQATAAATSDEEIELIKEWKANKSVLVNALIRSGSEKSDEPKVVELKSSVWGQITGMIAEYADAGVDLMDAKSGQDFVVTRTGRGQNDTKYTVMLAPKSDPVPDEAFDAMQDLKQFIESNFFRGDETKALTAIAQVTGVSIGASHQLTAPRPASGLLNKPAAQVEDAEVAAVADALVGEAEAIEEVAAEEVVAEVVETEEEKELREFREFKAAQAAKAAAAKPAVDVKAAALAAAKLAAEKKAAAEFAAKKKAAVETVVTKTDEFNSTLPQDEIDALLEGLT